MAKIKNHTIYDLLTLFYEAVRSGSYKAIAKQRNTTTQDIYVTLAELEQRVGCTLIHNLPTNTLTLAKYPNIVLTANGAKWWMIMSELNQDTGLADRINHFKNKSLMPLGFEPIAYI